jgi:AsmA protein
MKKAGIIIGIIVGVVVVAGLIFWTTFDVNQYRGRIQAELQTRLARSVSLGSMSLSLFPPSFQVKDLSIGDDPQFANPKPFVQAGQLSVSANLIPLLRGGLEITSLELRQPVIELIKDEKGTWNFSSLGGPGGGQPAPASTGNTPGGSFSLAGLSVEDGQIALTDRQSGQPRAVYSHIDVRLKDLAPDKPFSVRAAVQLPGKDNQQVRLEGTGGPIKPGDLSATPFHGILGLDGIALAGLQQFLNEPALAHTDGTVKGETKIDLQDGTASADGDLNIQSPRVRGVDLGYPITAKYIISDDLDAKRLIIKKVAIRLGSSPLDMDGEIDLRTTPAQLDLNVKADNLSLAEASRLAAAFGIVISPGTTIAGRVNTKMRITGAADSPVLSGVVSAADVQVSGKDIPQPVEIKTVNFRVTPSDIRSDTFDIRSGQTTIKTNVALEQYASNSPSVDAHLEAPNAQLPAILAIAKAYGVRAVDNVKGNGSLKLDMRVSGPVQSLDGDALMRALNGETAINFNNLQLSGTNLSQEISKVAGFLKPVGAAQGFTDISVMTGRITVRNGIAQTSDLKAGLDIGTIAVTGTADLVAQVLNLHVNAVVAEKVSGQVGGKGIRGFMKTALANDQGELIIPVLVTGTFQQPKVTPDVRSFGRMKLKGLLPTSSDPGAGLSGLVDSLFGAKGSGQPGEAQTKPQQQKPAPNALQQFLEVLSEKKNQQQTQPKPKK